MDGWTSRETGGSADGWVAKYKERWLSRWMGGKVLQMDGRLSRETAGSEVDGGQVEKQLAKQMDDWKYCRWMGGKVERQPTEEKNIWLNRELGG